MPLGFVVNFADQATVAKLFLMAAVRIGVAGLYRTARISMSCSRMSSPLGSTENGAMIAVGMVMISEYLNQTVAPGINT